MMPDKESTSARLRQLAALNEQLRSCTQCRLCDTRKHVICGEGNTMSRIFFIAQAPGEREDHLGRMFMGPTGKIVDDLFAEIGLSRHDVYMTNLLKCHLPHNRKPKHDEIEACGRFLIKEIVLVNPRIVIPLGYYATRFVFQYFIHESMEIARTYDRLFYGGGLKIFPMHHPSSVLYNPEFKDEMSRVFRKIKIFQADCKWYPVCPMRRYFERGKLERKWIELYCRGDWENCVRYKLEEKGQPHPDNMLPDGSIDNSLDC